MDAFPADQLERDLDVALDEALSELDSCGHEFNWPRIRRGIERWTAAQERGLDNQAREQEMEA